LLVKIDDVDYPKDHHGEEDNECHEAGKEESKVDLKPLAI
jgi:hypothetical protein